MNFKYFLLAFFLLSGSLFAMDFPGDNAALLPDNKVVIVVEDDEPSDESMEMSSDSFSEELSDGEFQRRQAQIFLIHVYTQTKADHLKFLPPVVCGGVALTLLGLGYDYAAGVTFAGGVAGGALLAAFHKLRDQFCIGDSYTQDTPEAEDIEDAAGDAAQESESEI